MAHPSQQAVSTAVAGLVVTLHSGGADSSARDASERDEPFRLMVQNIKDYAIFMLDHEGRVMNWNPGAERITGYTASEILGRSFEAFYPEEALASGFPKYELAIAARDGRFEDENWRLRKDGTRFWANVIITALHRADGTIAGFAKVTRDLTVRREAEDRARQLAAEHAAHAAAPRQNEALHALNTRLESALAEAQTALAAAERAASARDEVLAVVAHDLRNPIHTILCSVSVLETTTDDAQRQRPRGVIRRAAKEMERLISGLVDGARIDAGALTIDRESVDVRGLILETLDQFESQAQARNIALDHHVAAEVHMVAADKSRLLQVLSNLLGNALKFTPEARGVSVRAVMDADAVHFSVKDSGNGIAEQDLPFIFDRFWQAKETACAGTGLGLTICKGIVQAHGGRIWAASKVGRGTTVHFTIPRAFKSPGRAENSEG